MREMLRREHGYYRPRASAACLAAACTTLWGSRTWHSLLASGDRWSGTIAAVSLRLLRLILAQVLGTVLLMGRRANHHKDWLTPYGDTRGRAW